MEWALGPEFIKPLIKVDLPWFGGSTAMFPHMSYVVG